MGIFAPALTEERLDGGQLCSFESRILFLVDVRIRSSRISPTSTGMSTVRELAASVAHEVNQPLPATVALACGFGRTYALNLEEAQESVRDILRDGKRAGEVIARIRALTKRAAPPGEKLDRMRWTR